MTIYTVKWLPRSVKSYRRVLDYLQKEWGQKVLNKFIDESTPKTDDFYKKSYFG